MKRRILEVLVLCFALALRANAQTPLITSPPQSITINNASTATFTVTASNVATYQWQFNGASLPGETNSTLTYDDAGTNEAGSYTVVVTSSNNLSVTSAPPAVLTIVPGTIIRWTISTYANGSSSNFLVQLFDHDKPASVENFVHYITSGAYSNTFFDRDVTNFVLQGGDYVTSDRATNGVTARKLSPGTNFPSQVDSEFNVGPLIHNKFGTLAMALQSGESNSATSAFFFNLADNSTNLDNQNGGFTVFGRILDGTNTGSNVLQYFTTLSAPSNGIYEGFGKVPTLPVNFDGTNIPTDANFFYSDFTVVSLATPTDTNPPTASITFPAANADFTNSGDLTVTGTASDNVGIAEVFCVLTQLSGFSSGQSQTNVALGTANWSLDFGSVSSGNYQLTAYVEDGAGNLRSPATETFTVTTVVPNTMVQITFSGFPDGSTSNVVVELFNQQRPATVANFLHYITPVSYEGFFSAVAFSNMVWDRCIPGFILQGGDYDATDRTNGTPLPQLNSIEGDFTGNPFYLPPFASQVDSEFNDGPVIPNTFGTLAMSLVPGQTNSATSSFFFNLADNSEKLDSQYYTVFGRVVSGSNVLQYFNTLSKPNEGIFDATAVGANLPVTDLPVNYHGWDLPANSNLFFADFTNLSTYNADTTPPGIAVSSPTNGQTMTAADVVVEGTAGDNVAVANVQCTCTGSNFSRFVYAVGTTNWSVDLSSLPPGTYTNNAVAQDGSGNSSTAASVTFVVPRFPFESSVNGNGTLSTNLNGTNATVGAIYTITATPGKNVVFVDWVSGTNAYLNPTQTFAMPNGEQLTANFVSLSNMVYGGVSMSYPVPKETNQTVSITGRVTAAFAGAPITCQIFSAGASNSVTAPVVVTATNNVWSTPPLSLAPGQYVGQAVAQNARGKSSVVSRPFAMLTPLTVNIYGHGTADITNGTYLAVGAEYVILAKPAIGQKFFSWNTGAGALPYQSFSFVMTKGAALTVIFVSNSLPGKLTITTPSAGAQLTTPTVTVTGKITATDSPQVICQLFNGEKPVTDFMPATITGTTWTVTASNLTMGSYTAQALTTDASGKTTTATRNFVVNFYPRIAGTYHGLFFDTNLLVETNAGYFSFSLGSSGTVDGSLVFPNRSYPLVFSMGSSSFATILPNFRLAPALTLTMNFDVTNFSGVMTGNVAQGSEVCPLTAYRAATKLSTNTPPAPGNYVLSLPPETTNGPPGDGFASVSVLAGGILNVAGAIADDTSFSESTGVFTNGVWPVFAKFFNGQGMLIGWETNQPSGTNAGELFWLKSPGYGAYDTNGVNERINSIGAKYIAPAPGAAYQIVFADGTIPLSAATQKFSFNAAGAIVPAAGTTDQLKGSLVLTTGVLKGSVVSPLGATINFSGAFISPSEGGSGFTLDGNSQTGSFQITPAP